MEGQLCTVNFVLFLHQLQKQAMKIYENDVVNEAFESR